MQCTLRQGKGEASAAQSEQRRESPGKAYRSALPPEFIAVIGRATPEIVGALIQNHPQLSTPLMTAINQLRGHGFAQQAVAAAARATLHKPTPIAAEPATIPTMHQAQQPATTPTPPPARAEPKVSAELRKMRAVAGWNQLATAVPDESMTPEHVRLPDHLVQAIQIAWHETIASAPEHEHGGNIVKNGGSGYDLRRYDGDADGETFQPNDNDVGWRQHIVGMVHTHPYGEYKTQVPEGYASFSEQDFDAFMRSDAHLSVLRSGPFTFMLSKTKQFEELVAASDNDESKLRALGAEMYAAYDDVFDRTKGNFSGRVEAGILAVCRKFHLVYYQGQDGDLTRKSGLSKR